MDKKRKRERGICGYFPGNEESILKNENENEIFILGKTNTDCLSWGLHIENLNYFPKMSIPKYFYSESWINIYSSKVFFLKYFADVS